MREKVQEVERRRAKLLEMGGEREAERQHKRGKLTARERIAKLVDPGTFMEFDLWAKPRRTGFDIDKKEMPADGVIAGSGEVNGRPIYLYAQDFTVHAGTLASVGAKKIVKAMKKSLEQRVPCIGLIDSGGVRVQDAVEADRADGYIQMFKVQSNSSGVVPQISLLMGPCAAGACYSPALTDFLFMVKDTSSMYIAGPPLVKAVTFADVTEQELGGAEMHASVSGCCDLVAEDDEDCLLRTRELLSFLPCNNREKPPIVDTGDDPNRRAEELLDVVPTNAKRPYDMHAVIKHIVDNGHFFEVKAKWARNMITGFGRLGGQSVGFVANNPKHLAGAIDIDASDKEARFIRFCDCFNIPVIFLVDTPAYLPGVKQEYGGIIRHGAKVLHSISEATVPLLTVYIRKGYGGGAPAMCTEVIGSDLLLAWPTAELGLMGPEGAVSIIYRNELAAAANREELYRQRIEEYNTTFGEDPYHAGHVRWVEDIIDPRDTRRLLITGLRVAKDKAVERPWKKFGNIPL